jgi:hypothetical protein
MSYFTRSLSLPNELEVGDDDVFLPSPAPTPRDTIIEVTKLKQGRALLAK